MAGVRGYCQEVVAACVVWAALGAAPALAEDRGPYAGTDLYDRPVLAVDPGMHTAQIWGQAVDAKGAYAVTGGADRTVRVWSVADGKLLRTIWVPAGPDKVGVVYAVAISPDGSTIAAGGVTERMTGGTVLYLFARDSGALVRRISGLPNVTNFLTFSPDGRFLAATLGAGGIRAFDRDKAWSEAFRDEAYGDQSYGAGFAPDGRLATTSLDGKIRLYKYDPNMPVRTTGGLGVRLTQENGVIAVAAAIEDMPAARAGVLAGDVIAAIDDAPTLGLTLDQAVAKMRGAVGAPVRLTIVRGPQKTVEAFTLVRDRIPVQPSTRIGDPVRAPSGDKPYRIAFSPDGRRLAVGYDDVVAVDVLDSDTLARIGGHKPPELQRPDGGATNVAWSSDGETLFATGNVRDAQGRFFLLAWDRGGLGAGRRLTYCAQNTATDVSALPDGRILMASLGSCLGVMDARGAPIWTIGSPLPDFRNQELRASADGSLVDFVFGDATKAIISSADPKLRFDLRSLTLSTPPPNDDRTLTPNREGLTIDGWQDQTNPSLAGRPLRLQPYDIARSLAIAADAKRFVLGSSFGLTAFDDAGTQTWRRSTAGEVRAVNASRDGRVVVAAEGDGAIRWYRSDDGRELLALQVLANRKDWVLWTPEGFYEATEGAQDVLKWVTNHGPDKAATTLPVSAIPKLHRPDALPHVLDQLETEHALGVGDVTQARLDVQAKTGSAKPPGGELHVLAIGIDRFGDKAAGLKLNYAAEDARDVATALRESQNSRTASLYAGVDVQYLSNEEAGATAILDALDRIAAKQTSDQDVAVIDIASHGEMIDNAFYFIPYGFDASSDNGIATTAVSAYQFAKKIQAIAKHGKVLLLLDACHSGAVGAGSLAKDPDARALQAALDMENVTVLTSSKSSEASEELPAWRHGAFTEAFLDALRSAADNQGLISVLAMTEFMDNEVQSLTKGRQHLGVHPNFTGPLFVAAPY